MTELAPFRVRAARLPEDKPAILGFFTGIQHFEKTIEADRRIDPDVAEDSVRSNDRARRSKNGCVLIAETTSGEAIGWAVGLEDEQEIYIVAEERTHGYIAELYVVEDMRGRGVGRALIAACEEWARGRGLKVMMIGVLYAQRPAPMRCIAVRDMTTK